MIPHNLFPAGTKWCIAGGYAACPALATDIDVWVYDVKEIARGDIGYRRAELIAYVEQWVASQNINRPIWPERRYRFETQEQTETMMAYDQLVNHIEKVGVLYSPRSAGVKPIHLMVTTAYDPGSLISGFDVSTHAVAIDHDGRLWKHALWTAPHQPPAVIQVNAKTQERYQRICKRFGHPEVIQDFTEVMP